MLGYVHKTTKIWRIWGFSGRGRAVECSNVIFKEEENAYDATIEEADAIIDGDIFIPTDGDSDSDGSTNDEIPLGGEESTYSQYKFTRVITLFLLSIPGRPGSGPRLCDNPCA